MAGMVKPMGEQMYLKIQNLRCLSILRITGFWVFSLPVAVSVLIIFVVQNGKYAATRSFERSLTWVDPGKDRNAPGGELWLGGVGK
jgi:hypothetical protein